VTKDGKTIGLALSGGGFRATLFGLGSLWRLNETGLLGKLDRITSVSGGSILAGVLAQRWTRLHFTDGTADNFVAEIASPVRAFCDRTIDIGAGLEGLLSPFKSAGEFLVERYARDLFGETTLSELPDARSPGNPKFVFYATNLQTGRSFRFRQDMLADYKLGTVNPAGVSLAFAVGASSAFPPVFSPVTLEVDPGSWSGGSDEPEFKALRGHIMLCDGGVYDNMGLECLVDNVDIVLVSDAGAPFEVVAHPASDYLLQLGRVRDILIDQTRALRKRWLISDFEAERKRGGYWGIDTRIDSYGDAETPFEDTSITKALSVVPTRLARFDAYTQNNLINWGYALSDLALRRRARLDLLVARDLPLEAD